MIFCSFLKTELIFFLRPNFPRYETESHAAVRLLFSKLLELLFNLFLSSNYGLRYFFKQPYQLYWLLFESTLGLFFWKLYMRLRQDDICYSNYFEKIKQGYPIFATLSIMKKSNSFFLFWTIKDLRYFISKAVKFFWAHLSQKPKMLQLWELLH